MGEKADYGNWVPRRWLMALVLCWMALFVAAYVALCHAGSNRVINVLTIVLWVMVAIVMVAIVGLAWLHHYFQRGFMQRVYKLVGDQLSVWNGEGRVLDVGCGNGGLTIALAKRFIQAHVTGVDIWGPKWDYGKAACEKNAQADGVDTRTEFLYGSAVKLPFNDNTFDVIVSNYVFHEVGEQKDKNALIAEALRVLKPGGYFAIHDLFYDESIYLPGAQLEQYLATLATEAHVRSTAPDLNLHGLVSRMLARSGMIYGKK